MKINLFSEQIYQSTEYTYATHESCCRVVHPMSGSIALDIACGGYIGNQCTPEKWELAIYVLSSYYYQITMLIFNFFRWYEYMGSVKKNDLVPFDIKYVYEKEKTTLESPLNPPTIPCHRAYDVRSYIKSDANAISKST